MYAQCNGITILDKITKLITTNPLESFQDSPMHFDPLLDKLRNIFLEIKIYYRK